MGLYREEDTETRKILQADDRGELVSIGEAAIRALFKPLKIKKSASK